MLKEEILAQIRQYLVSNQDGDDMSQIDTRALERGELIRLELKPGESLEYIDQIRREGTISNVKIIDAGTFGDAYDNNSKLVIYWVDKRQH
ncbi:MAG: hypothetical protein OXG10_04985 [Candidatus Dadabacteria bacterium]|nr:hypothetical protein [Candidatus Dadabacteria bacterium]